MSTSARNVFFGKVTAVRETPLLTEVTFQAQANYAVVSIISTESYERLALREGEQVMAIIKAPGVLVGKGPKGAISTRNCFPGRVTDIHRDGAVVEVMGELDDGTPMCALCTLESLQRLDIKENDAVWFFFKSIGVILSAENRTSQQTDAER